MKTINIKLQNSPARKHIRFLKVLEKQAFIAYRVTMRKMIEELRDNLQKDKLMKSDDPRKLGTGWTGEVPQIKMNMSDTINKTIAKYMLALRWILLGDYAGKEARNMAKKLGFVGKVVPGIMQASYLNSIDSHREHYVNLTGELPKDLPKYLLEGGLDKIAERTNRYLNQVTINLENNILNALDGIMENLNTQNIAKAHRKATGMLDDTGTNPEAAIEKATDGLRTTIPKSWFDKELRQTVNNFRPNWERTVRGELGLASAAATHQAVQDIYGGNDDEMRVVWLTSRNDRVCKYCNHASMHPNGEFKYYKLGDFKPSGWNIGKKRDQWALVIPPGHPNCKCVLVYVPPGFRVLQDGSLVPL